MIDEEIGVDLTEKELELLDAGLRDWGRPAASLSAATGLLGFNSIAECKEELASVSRKLDLGEGLTRLQWTRTLLAAEIMFASEVVGCRGEWTIIHAGTDEEWFAILLKLQRKVPVDRRLLTLGPRREPW